MPGLASPYIQFGSGLLFLNPNAGNLAANPTPVKPLTIQDVKLGQKGKIEMLRGQSQYPDDTATGDKDGTFEFAMGRKDYYLLNQIFNADTVASGGVSVSPNESHAIAATVTVVPPSSGTFSEDMGVTWNGKEMTKVAASPATGQYSVNISTGAYSFNATDVTTGGNVLISYSYTATAGNTYQVNNQVQGYGPAFEAFIVDTYQPVSGVYSTVRLYAAKISDVEFTNKRSGYADTSLKGSYYASPSTGRVIDYYSNAG
jgi:hypothetical protein